MNGGVLIRRWDRQNLISHADRGDGVPAYLACSKSY
ncbi:MAG: hypothetical protein RIQ93_1475 [Verrucomicrobiota bacterium]|jgi:hypothetical protein